MEPIFIVILTTLVAWAVERSADAVFDWLMLKLRGNREPIEQDKDTEERV